MNNVEGRRIFLPLSDRCKDGRVYQVNNRARNGIIYLRCHNSTFCFGTAKFENNYLVHARPHSQDCLPDERSALIGAFKKSLKDSLATHWYRLRDLFDQTALLYPEAAALVTFQSLKSYMMRCRRISYPVRPSDIREFSEQLDARDNERMLEYASGRFTTKLLVDDDGNKHLVIYDEQFITTEMMRDVKKLFIDATFRSTPYLEDAYQLMTIMGIKFNHGIPFIWAIMSRKLELSYLCVFQYIRDNILREAHIDLIMSDFEAAIRNASNRVFPQAHCTGCNTHYDRALLQKLKSLGLQRFIHDNEDAKLLTKKLLVLAYLPAEVIEQQYFETKNDLPANLKRRFHAFFSYYERYWLRTVSPHGFSVFGLSRRTNNILESYNSKLGYHLQARPSPWEFISKLLILQNHAKCDVERSKRRSGGITRHARYQTAYKNNELQKAWKELYFRRITYNEFITRATFLKGNITQAMLKESNDREGEDFEVTVTPRQLPLENDPDYDAGLFRGGIPGPFMRDNAQQGPEQRADVAGVLDRPPTPDRLNEPDQVLDEPAIIPARAPTPEWQEEEVVLVAPMAERPHTPARDLEVQDEEDIDFGINDEAPPHPEPIIGENEALAPDRPQAAAQEAGGEVATGSRNSRRRMRQRQRRRNIAPGQVPDAVRRIRRKRRRTNPEGPNGICVVCLILPITHAFLPCGHRCCCDTCSTRIYCDGDLRRCPTCRADVERSPVRVFITN